MFRNKLLGLTMVAGAALVASSIAARAQSGPACPVTYAQLKSALTQADQADSTGFNNHSWGVVVARGGTICAVAYSGPNTQAQWLGSRQIAAAKAFTANAFSLDRNIGTGTAELSTAQLYQFVQPSNQNVTNPLFGLNGGNVQDATLVYLGNYNDYGTEKDPMVGYRLGGTITFGGGLALYQGNRVVGGLGLSGDTACADHSSAWRTRIILGLQPNNPADQLPFATTAGTNMQDGHPHCPNDTDTQGAKNNTPAAMAKN